MTNFYFNKEEGILNIEYSEKITDEGIKNLYEQLLNLDLPENLFIFQNEVNAEFIDSDILIPRAVEFYTKLSKKHKRIEIAVWQTEPVKTAYSFIFKNLLEIDNLQIKIFYTKKAALDWLKKL